MISGLVGSVLTLRGAFGLLGATDVAAVRTSLPVARVLLDGGLYSCIVDTGCERTIVSPRVVAGKDLRPGTGVVTADGVLVRTRGKRRMMVGMHGHCFRTTVLVVPGISKLGVDCLLGGDIIRHMGGVAVIPKGDQGWGVAWGKPRPSGCCKIPKQAKSTPAATVNRPYPTPVRSHTSKVAPAAANVHIEDKDFVADFRNGKWTVSWRWVAGPPSSMQTRMTEYRCTKAQHIRDKYCSEIDSWISKGWLRPWDGPVTGVIPLLAVVQPTKDKVRPVLDYRELNDYVECHTGDNVAVCNEKLRTWRQLKGELKLVDLRSAYLQIHVAPDLWKYQVVQYKGKYYSLTRLGFGLSCAPRVMTMILSKVLSMNERIRRGTDHYIDDIIVQEKVVSASEVRKHLATYGLETKDPESLNGGKVLGVSLTAGEGEQLKMSRGSPIDELEVGDKLTKRQLFSLCGRLIGHYPVAGWLRPYCSYLKRLGSDGSWDTLVNDTTRKLAVELIEQVKKEDPVTGQWHVDTTQKTTVWTDASSIALGVVLEVGGNIVEDATWLRKEADVLHINVAELEAVARGINLALAWDIHNFEIATDSQTVASWMNSIIERRSRVKTRGAAEMLIKRRLRVIAETIEEFKLNVSVRLVPTTINKSDRLTRVPKRWLSRISGDDEDNVVVASITAKCSVKDAVWEAHLPHHFGISRTWYLAKQILPGIKRNAVKTELKNCELCQQIDPALQAENRVAEGDLAVCDNWSRVAIDVTHCNNQLYLSIVDCGPSRFALWRRLNNETSSQIIAQLQNVMLERGPCVELLLDNATAFRSEEFCEFADRWKITLRYRAAHVPSGNGIVERNHRTIKRMVARGGIPPEEAVYWYNVTPRKETDPESVPSAGLHNYAWRVPLGTTARPQGGECRNSSFEVGDKVWVKPYPPSCTKRWTAGEVTSIVSPHTICINGMPRHIRDIRRRRGDAESTDDEDGFPMLQQIEVYNGNDGVVNEVIEPVVEEEAARQEDVVVINQDDDQLAAEPHGDQVRRSTRVTRRPAYLDDYVTTGSDEDE